MATVDFDILFKQRLHKEWQDNLTQVNLVAQRLKKNIYTKKDLWLDKKIKEEVVRTGDIISYDEILQELCDGRYCAMRLFAKDPLKQNFAENLQIEYLKQTHYKNIIKLKSGGLNAHYLFNGEIITNVSSAPKDTQCTKSLDFLYSETDNQIYFYAKYTNDEGGAQDNQTADAQKFVVQANEYCNKNKNNKLFVLLCDGKHYSRDLKNNLRKKIDDNNKSRVFVCGSTEFVNLKLM